MRRVVLLLVGVAAVASLPVQDAQSSTQAEVIHKLLLANPEDNSIIPKLKDDRLPSPSSVPRVSPSPSPSPSLSPIPMVQMSTSTEEQDKKLEDNQEQVKEQKEQQNSEQTQPQVNEKPIIVIKPLPVESDVEEIPFIPQLVPIRVEYEVEQIPPNDDLGYMSSEDYSPEEPFVEYFPLDAEEEEEVVDEYEEDEFPVEPVIVDFPLEAEGDEFPVEPEDVDLPFAPDFESLTESEEEYTSFESGNEPLPPRVYEDGPDLESPTESEEEYTSFESGNEPLPRVYEDGPDLESPTESEEEYTSFELGNEPLPPRVYYEDGPDLESPTESEEKYMSFELGNEPLPHRVYYEDGPDLESPTESEEKYTSFESGNEPLPPRVYEDGSDLGVTEEEGGIIYVYPPMKDQDSDVPVDADVEEPYEPFEPQEEDDTMTDENIPPGFFSWVLPGFFGDEEFSEDIPPSAETPSVEDTVEYEVEEDLSPEVSEGEMLEEDTYPDTVDALVVDSGDSVLPQEEDYMSDEVISSELEPFMIDDEVGSVEEVMDEEVPYEEEEDVYFPPNEDYMYDMPEDAYPLYDTLQEYEYFDLQKPEYYNPTEIIYDDEMPEGPHGPYVLVDEPNAPGLKNERDESPEDEPVLPDNEPVADNTPVLIAQPPRTLQIGSSNPSPGLIALRDILFPFLNMNSEDREEGIIMMEREEASGSPQYDMHIMVLGNPQDLHDAQVPVMPIVGESVIPQGRPFPIAEFPDQDFHHMDHPSNWTPDDDDDDDDNNNNNEPSFFHLNSNPNTFPMLFDQFSDNLPHSSFYEPEVRPQQWTQSRNRFVSKGGHFPAHGNNMQHHHQPPRIMDSATPFIADASHPNDFGVNFNNDYESYEPPMKFKKKLDATSFQPNLNGFNTFKPSYSEVFGFPHSHDHGPSSPPRSFSFSQHYHGSGPFRPPPYHNPDSHPQKSFMYPSTSFTTPQYDFNVFQPSGGLQYRPEQDIYLSGPQIPLDPYTSFYQASSHHNPRAAPFTSFSRSQSQLGKLGNTYPMELNLYPERETYHQSPFNFRPQFPFLPFPVKQQSFNGDNFSPAYYDRSHSPPQQSYHASPLYSSNHANARYAPGYP